MVLGKNKAVSRVRFLKKKRCRLCSRILARLTLVMVHSKVFQIFVIWGFEDFSYLGFSYLLSGMPKLSNSDRRQLFNSRICKWVFRRLRETALSVKIFSSRYRNLFNLAVRKHQSAHFTIFELNISTLWRNPFEKKKAPVFRPAVFSAKIISFHFTTGYKKPN